MHALPSSQVFFRPWHVPPRHASPPTQAYGSARVPPTAAIAHVREAFWYRFWAHAASPPLGHLTTVAEFTLQLPWCTGVIAHVPVLGLHWNASQALSDALGHATTVAGSTAHLGRAVMLLSQTYVPLHGSPSSNAAQSLVALQEHVLLPGAHGPSWHTSPCVHELPPSHAVFVAASTSLHTMPPRQAPGASGTVAPGSCQGGPIRDPPCARHASIATAPSRGYAAGSDFDRLRVRNEFPQPFGPYELLRRLGRGGMAEVFLAKASTSRGEKRLVALKRMHQTLSEDQSAVAMLIEEARLCMRFHHDHIAQTFELGNHEGTWFFIMEYVDGVDLGTVANLAEGRSSRLDPAAVAYICAAMARGLDYAHELGDEHGKRLGIVHRDVSPQNVLIGRHGEVKLIDFGVAKVASRIQQTMAGIIKGKYAYMSPEQASAETVDQRSDVFSLGICMHELFAGRPLFRALGSSSPFAILRAVRDEPIPKVADLAPGLPPELARIVHKALERDLKKRYPSAGMLAQELEAWLQRAAPRFDATALATYVRTLVEQAPSGTLPQSAIATPPLAKMKGDEFEPSQMSVVAVSPLEMAGRETIARAPPTLQRKPSAPGRVPSMQFPREQFQAQLAQAAAPQMPQLAMQPQAMPATSAPATALRARDHDWRPSRRATRQFLWVGVVALVFALGWSTIATLVKMGKL